MRFPGFEGEWDSQRLGDFVDRVTRRNRNLEAKRPLTISAQYGLIDQTAFFKKTVASQDISNYYLLYNGEFAYNKSYSSEYPWGAVKRLDLYDKGVLSSLYICFKPNDNNESDFLVHYFESTKWYQGVADIAGEGARNHGLLNISIPDYFNTQHFLPGRKEQRRIADFLNLVEKRIVVQSKVIEDLRSLFDVICQKLYSSNEKKEWHEFKYADLLTISNERNSRLQYTNVLSASQEYGMVERGELNIDIKYDATSIKNYKIVHPNEYVIHLRSFQGGFAYSDKTGICSPAYTILVPNGKLIPAFLKYYFTSTQFINSLRIVTYGIRDGRSISVEEFLQLKISIPTISEQNYILSVMQLWEEKIRIEECHLSNLQKQKQYLLRQMFI